MFNKMVNVDAVKADLVVVQGNENSTRKILNARVPEIAEGVIAGDNISVANMVMRVCVGHRKSEMFLFLKHVLPFTFDDEKKKFLKKSKDEKMVKIKEDNYTAFKASGMTVFGWLDANLKVEAKEVDYLGRVTKAVKAASKHKKAQREIVLAAIEGGLEIETIMAVLKEAVNAEDKAA